jgi:two-component system cell cycle sensor histidine kinase/response regulator CckA
MIRSLTFVSPRNNDTLTMRRGRALALVMLLFVIVEIALGSISLIDRDLPALINTAIGLVVSVLVYAVNRSGKVRQAMVILLIGGTIITIIGAIIAQRPIPTLFFLGLIVVVAAAFGRPLTPILWAAALSFTPFIINTSIYGSPLAPITPILTPGGHLLPSIFTQELEALALLWMLAGTAYLASRLLNQLLDASIADMDDMRAVQQTLRQSEERFSKIFQASPVAISITTFDDGRFVDANESFLNLLGYQRSEIIGRTSTDLQLWAHSEEREQIVQALRERGSVNGVEVTFKTKSREPRTVLHSVEVIVLNGESCVLTLSHDITARKNLELQLLQIQKMETIGQLAGGVAHDFNNLLTAITGYADLAIEELPSDHPVRGDLKELRKATGRATDLTRQLLTFARKQKIEPRVLNLNELVVDMDRLIRRLIGEGIELITLMAPDLKNVRADPGQIEQVLANLVVNAHDAMPTGGQLAIETANVFLDSAYARNHVSVVVGQYVLLAVSDTGVGMDTSIQEHLFEPFFTTKEPGRGTGLGLSTCYGIVKQHGGYIWPYSEVGRGTTFQIYLPCVSEATDPPRAPDDLKAWPQGSETILLVEDEAAVRELAARVLREQGYTVLEAGDGAQALRVAASHGEQNIHLLLTDIVLPLLGGRALAEQLSARYSRIKVLFTSGYTDDAIIHQGRVDASINFLHKPFSPASLVRKVRVTLDQS